MMKIWKGIRRWGKRSEERQAIRKRHAYDKKAEAGITREKGGGEPLGNREHRVRKGNRGGKYNTVH